MPPLPPQPPARPWIGVYFSCCRAYARLYRTVDGTAYAGHCPRCARPARVKIGEGGTSGRFFTVG